MRKQGNIPPVSDRGPVWQCPDPRQLPELRGELATWLAGRGVGFYLECLLGGSQQIRPPGSLLSSAAALVAAEHTRITAGELFWVSAEMTELARHAGRQLSRCELYEHELPSRTGFMVFQTPLATTVNDGIRVEIVAVSWGVVTAPLLVRDGPFEMSVGAGWAHGYAVWFTFYSDPKGFLEANLAGFTAAKQKMLAEAGPFMPDNELVWPLGQLEELPEGEDFTSAWGQIVVAAWLLMRQPLTVYSTERAPRPARRRMARAGLPAGDVRLIHVRRPQRRTITQPAAERGGRQYSVQWWVEGHWRRYHCGPGRARIERRWINPYLAGPDDKPVRGTHRVNVWDR